MAGQNSPGQNSPDGRGVAVFGSINVDISARVAALPRPGETVMGGDLSVTLGGKGANQAVAAALSGAPTAMIGAIGAQSFGLDPLGAMAGYGVATDGVATLDGTTGAALITVDERGENAIAVSPGANARAGEIGAPTPACAVLLAQLELPPPQVLGRFRTARAAGATTILNAAPAVPVPDELFALTDVLVVNETELASFSGADIGPDADDDAIRAAARRLVGDGGLVIVTLGGAGVLTLDRGATIRLPAMRANVVDTTGAGDCFCGWLAAGLATGPATGLAAATPLEETLTRAVAAAALCVERAGAAPAMPTRTELEAALSGL